MRSRRAGPWVRPCVEWSRARDSLGLCLTLCQMGITEAPVSEVAVKVPCVPTSTASRAASSHCRLGLLPWHLPHTKTPPIRTSWGIWDTVLSGSSGSSSFTKCPMSQLPLSAPSPCSRADSLLSSLPVPFAVPLRTIHISSPCSPLITLGYCCELQTEVFPNAHHAAPESQHDQKLSARSCSLWAATGLLDLHALPSPGAPLAFPQQRGACRLLQAGRCVPTRPSPQPPSLGFRYQNLCLGGPPLTMPGLSHSNPD